MSETRPWTKGEWAISEARGVDGEYWIVGGAGQDFGLIAEVTTKDDATLILAAPALAEALDAAIICLRNRDQNDREAAAVAAGLAALNKALGKE